MTVYAVIAGPEDGPLARGYGYVATRTMDGKNIVPWQEKFLFADENDAKAEAERLDELEGEGPGYYQVFPLTVF